MRAYLQAHLRRRLSAAAKRHIGQDDAERTRGAKRWSPTCDKSKIDEAAHDAKARGSHTRGQHEQAVPVVRVRKRAAGRVQRTAEVDARRLSNAADHRVVTGVVMSG